MPALSFNVFKDKILDGRKSSTIRKPRKRPFKTFENLYLYWKQRSRECEKLGEAVCLKVERILIISTLGCEYDLVLTKGWKGRWHVTHDDDIKIIARRDGFDSVEAFFEFFRSNYLLPQEFDLIEWYNFSKEER